jgi:tyrosyl-tRNA synthetase
MVNERKFDDIEATVQADLLDDAGELLLRAGKKRLFRIVAKK